MALKAMLKTLDGLEAPVKALYKQDGDKFMLDVEPTEGFELVGGGLKTALLKEREAREAAEKRIEQFKDVDPDKARDALKKVDAMKNWTPDEKVRELIEVKTKELAAQKDAEYAPKLKSAEATRKAYESLVIDKALEDAAAKHKFLAPALAPKLFRESVSLVEKDGKLLPVVLGQDGKPAMKVENSGATRNVTIDEFMAEKAQDPMYAPLIAGNGATGTQGRLPEGGRNDKPKTVHYSQSEALERFANTL